MPKLKCLKWFIPFLILSYLLCFLIQWIFGGYILTESGNTRTLMNIKTGIAVPDVAEWQPLFGHYQKSYAWPSGKTSARSDLIGKIYFPLVRLVQRSRPPIELIDENGEFVRHDSLPDGFKYHPLRGEDLKKIIEAEN